MATVISRPLADREEDAFIDVYRYAHRTFGNNEALWTPAQWDAVRVALATVHAEFEQEAAA
ncbi:hypothetical protein ACFYO9_37670 [Streptomyces sp. NPDC005863]|uniref:hypothetical protein n=1 Tax=Streptomyces sp. NPDC005863 TaxID=3364735 RepID=UPI003674A8E3